jgi:long-chain acyl-CoA synthetase
VGVNLRAGTDVTTPKLLKTNSERWGDNTWMRKKELGFWRSYTWKEGYEKVKYFCLGLIALGYERGDILAIIGDNDPHWFWAELAAQSVGGAVCGVDATCAPDEVKHIVEHCDSRFVLAQDQEQVDKMLEIKDQLPLLRKVIYWKIKGMRHYDDPVLTSFDEVWGLGREYEVSHPNFFEEEIAKGRAEDVALLQYTSGSAGPPKGALFDYKALFAANEIFYCMNPVYETDEWVSFVLPGWMAEQGLGLVGSLNQGLRMNFPERPETVQENIREIGASLILYPSWLWEMVASGLQNRIAESTLAKRLLYQICLPVGYRMADKRLNGERPSLFWRLLYGLCDFLVFGPLKDKLGLLRLRYAYTAGGLLGPDIFRMMIALGVDLRQLYSCRQQGVAQHSPGEIKVDSVGRVNPLTTVRIMDDNHILARGAACALGYHKDPEATAEEFSGGWFHTGDAGYIDDEGHLYYLDRLEDMRELADGTRFAPQYLEARLKSSSYIKEVLLVGDTTRKFVGALVGIDYSSVGHWAERRNIPYATFADLSQKPAVCQLVAGEIEKLNERLPERQRVKRFLNLPSEFDAEEAEVARTMKARRGFLEDRYKGLIETLYGDRDRVAMEVPVLSQDGSHQVIGTEIQITRIGR